MRHECGTRGREPTVTGSLANEFDFAGQQTDPTGLQYLRLGGEAPNHLWPFVYGVEGTR